MTRKNLLIVFSLLLMAATVMPMTAAADGVGNPCGGKAANPCGMKAANPCGGNAMNPCGGKAANPCGMKAASNAGMPAVNPCFAKMGTVFMIADPMGRNTVTFKSEAPLEDIIGTTNDVKGYLVFDPKKPKKGGRGEIVIPVSSLHTGIPMRDEHLHGADWLDSANHGQITYRIDEVKSVREIKKGDGFVTYELTAKGPFTLHGVTKKLETKVTLTYLEESERTKSKMGGDLLAARTSFEVDLEDFNIRGFEGVVGSKVGSTINISVSVMASNMTEMAGNPCGGKAANPCGGKAMNPCGAKAANPCGAKASRKG